MGIYWQGPPLKQQSLTEFKTEINLSCVILVYRIEKWMVLIYLLVPPLFSFIKVFVIFLLFWITQNVFTPAKYFDLLLYVSICLWKSLKVNVTAFVNCFIEHVHAARIDLLFYILWRQWFSELMLFILNIVFISLSILLAISAGVQSTFPYVRKI